MPVVIREITSEVVLSEEAEPGSAVSEPPPTDKVYVERLVREVSERVLERLRREWER